MTILLILSSDDGIRFGWALVCSATELASSATGAFSRGWGVQAVFVEAKQLRLLMELQGYPTVGTLTYQMSDFSDDVFRGSDVLTCIPAQLSPAVSGVDCLHHGLSTYHLETHHGMSTGKWPITKCRLIYTQD